MGKLLRIDGFIGLPTSRVSADAVRGSLAHRLPRKAQHYCKEAAVNFLYMGSMFRFAKMDSDPVLCFKCPESNARVTICVKRSLLIAGYSDA